MGITMNDVTRLIDSIQRGDPTAAEQLLPLVYRELRQLAETRLSREQPGQTLQATALVHEAYLRLIGPTASDWQGRGHFFAAAAEAMRRIIVETARRKRAIRHGGDFARVNLDDEVAVVNPPHGDILALNDALQRLEEINPSRAEIVKLRYFTGLTVPQAAEAMGISVTTAERYWRFAKAWLLADISGNLPADGQD